MCRFAVYLGQPILLASLVTEPENSLIHQSFDSHESSEPLNGDGFGIAWYAPEISDSPALFKDVTPAWSDQNLAHLARVTSSSCLLAHVRAASPHSPVTRLNCHPFSWSRFSFMHNGRVGGFRKIERRLRELLSDEAYLRIQGSTDTEHVFALFCDLYSRMRGTSSPLARIRDSLVETLAMVEGLKATVGVDDVSFLNVVVTDGERAVVTRWTSGDPASAYSLYHLAGRGYECREGDGRVLEPGENGAAVLVASEPLTDDPGWRQVPPNHLLSIDRDLRIFIEPVSF